MSHDLKTPLQAFSFELSNLQRECEELIAPNMLSEFKRNVEANIDQLHVVVSFMNMAINRSLDYTKTSTGVELVPVISSVDIIQVMSWIVSSLSHKTNDSAEIVVESLPNNISKTIMTDKQWFIDNIFCYVSNALKFTFKAEIFIRCSLSADSHRNWKLVVEVEDNGIGLTDAQKSNLFQPFQQAQSRAGGTGLGLYSLKKRVLCLGGDCGVCDRENQSRGSIFWFSIPYLPDTPMVENFTAASASNETIVAKGNNHAKAEPFRVLVVDDSPLIQKTARKMLERKGYIVDVASNGFECLTMINSQKEKYDLILLDLHMPLMDGLETVSRLRNEEAENLLVQNNESTSGTVAKGIVDSFQRTKATVIIGFSGNSDERTKAEALEAGMDDFLSKPLRAEDLLCLEKHLVKKWI